MFLKNIGPKKKFQKNIGPKFFYSENSRSQNFFSEKSRSQKFFSEKYRSQKNECTGYLTTNGYLLSQTLHNNIKNNFSQFYNNWSIVSRDIY